MKAKKIEITVTEAEALLARVNESSLAQDDYELIKGLVDTVIILNEAVSNKSTSIKKLLQMVFGHKTEKNKNPPKKKKGNCNKKKKKGHGKNAAEDYTGAKRQQVLHDLLQHCGLCPDCDDGKLYRLSTPSLVVRIKGTSPFLGIIFELEQLRCNICGKVFTASLPPEAGTQKYDETASAMLALLRYGNGLPLNRIAQLQNGFGIPFAASTQWDVIEKFADRIHPVFTELIKQASQGDVIHNDDTTMKILELMIENQIIPKPSRTGIFTTNILSIIDGRKIALFFTGRKHAGENLAQVLEHRKSSLDEPIQMCDALSRNFSEDFKTILANCLAHGRRNFVRIVNDFPEQCQYVIDTLGEVYHNDAIASEKNMTPEQRLNFHQTNSGGMMEELHCWLKKQFDDNIVEPNSNLGQAIKYMIKHWERLTLFLRTEKAPLDNNICEQAIKMAILHRKNSLFYKTEHGAYIGDLFMTLIHTCNLSKINPFDYLTELHKNTSAIFKNPKLWMPWNYKENSNTPMAA